jgi:glycine amidinotransferase
MTGTVNSHNEWDPLEEVIVGRADFACLPEYPDAENYCCPEVTGVAELLEMMGIQADHGYCPERIAAANRKFDEVSELLTAEGVTVRRPDRFAFNKQFLTPKWAVSSGFNSCNPRDVFLVLGDTILECPMSSRGRYFESWPYKSLLKEYFHGGARWIAAPKPELADALYERDSPDQRFGISEFEPCFDAADFVRCGHDIIGQLSQVTNRCGVEWLRGFLGEDYRVHLIESRDTHAFHIDTTFMPLAPGRVLVNPEFLDMESIPAELRHWEFLVAPAPVPHPHSVRGFVSNWISMNVLSLDEKRILVDARQKPLIGALQDWGFDPMPLDASPVYAFGGGFHCITLDIRRRDAATKVGRRADIFKSEWHCRMTQGPVNLVSAD